MLSRLKWDICSITPHDFVDLLMTRLDVSNPWGPVRRTAHGYIALCALEYKFAMCPPSMIACACVTAALRNELDPTMSEADLSVNDILAQLQSITHIETVGFLILSLGKQDTNLLIFFQEILRGCFEQVDEFLRSLAPPPALIAPCELTNSSNASLGIASCPSDSNTSSNTTIVTAITKTDHEKAGTPTDVRDIHF